MCLELRNMNGMKPKINKIIIVEGRDDESAVKAAVDAHVIVTNGFSINKQTWELIEKAYKGPGIIILTDPDFVGENIRKRIAERFPKCAHAYLPKEYATKNGDIGIENASPDNIIEALEKPMELLEGITDPKENRFTMDDLLFFELIGSARASVRRSLMGKSLGIGSCNGKAFLARLNGYGITREEFYLNGQALFAGNGSKDNK